MSLSPETVSQLQSYVQSGDAASYYSTRAANGHDYGNLAYEAATDSGFWGQYANNFMENKASELGIPLDRNQIMRELMQKDFEYREDNQWEPIQADDIRKYHHEVFNNNGLPNDAWTGTFLDERAGPAAWCITCNDVERQGQSWEDAVSNFFDNVFNDWEGTFDQAIEFLSDALGDGVFSETMADINADATGSIEWGGFVKALYQTLATSAQGWLNISTWVNAFFLNARNWVQRRDPLTLDLDDDGLETTGIDPDNPILFDHDGDGTANATGWVKPDDGYLVFDRNENGLIDNGTELFGDSTPLLDENGEVVGNAADGFAALAAEDTNNDGNVDAGDANWDKLRVWQDLNSDGKTDEDELKTLEELGIAGFHVGKEENTQVLANGNAVADLGSYIRTDGSEGTLGEVTGNMADIDLIDNPFYREFSDTIQLTEQAKTLADMQSSGNVRKVASISALENRKMSREESSSGRMAA